MNMRKMDVPEEVYRWLAGLKVEMARERLADLSLSDRDRSAPVTFPEVFGKVMADHEARERAS